MKGKIFIGSFLLVTAGFFFWFSNAWAAEFPSRPQSYVSDFAKILDASTQARINNFAKELEVKTTAQVAVVTVPTTSPEPIENYAVKFFEQWGIGQKGKDNGVLLLVAVNDRQVRIEVGYGLEGALTDAMSRSIIERYIVPEFKSGQYSLGVLKGATAIISVVAKEYQVVITGQEGFYQEDLNRKSGAAGFLNFFFTLLFLLFLFSGRGGFLGWFLLGNMMGGRRDGYWHGSGFGGSGGFGGGFGGFGGGMSGGGGATGRW